MENGRELGRRAADEDRRRGRRQEDRLPDRRPRQGAGVPVGTIVQGARSPQRGRQGRRRGRSHLDGLRLGQGQDDRPVRRLCRVDGLRAHAALDLRGRRPGDVAAVQRGTLRAGFLPVFHAHRRSLPAFAQGGEDPRRSQGSQVPHGGRLAGDLQGARRGAGHHAGRRGLYLARARRDRRHRMGHALREHLVRLPQDRQIRGHSGHPPADRALRAGHQQERLGQAFRSRQAARGAGRQDGDLRELDAHRPRGRQGARLLQEGGQRDHRARRRRSEAGEEAGD